MDDRHQWGSICDATGISVASKTLIWVTRPLQYDKLRLLPPTLSFSDDTVAVLLSLTQLHNSSHEVRTILDIPCVVFTLSAVHLAIYAHAFDLLSYLALLSAK